MLSRKELARRAGLSRTTVAKFETCEFPEKGGGVPHANNLAAIRRVFEAEGIRFVLTQDGETARMEFPQALRPQPPQDRPDGGDEDE